MGRLTGKSPRLINNRSATATPMKHYENFPVASWLCPPRLRPAISAIYGFARTADDLADEGEAAASQRLADLRAFRQDLKAVADGSSDSGRWPQVFGPLRPVLAFYFLPSDLLEQLLDAFEQDVRFTANARRYATDAELLDYCTRSANPVGRLLLHLYGVRDDRSLAQSDQICSALQLINFWQDLSVDIARARWYPSLQAMQQHAVPDADLQSRNRSVNAARMVASYVSQARNLMQQGASLALRLPGRAGWELRLVVQGGLGILDKIEAMHYQSWLARPTLGLADLPLLLWRAWRMS
jgi:squalene synthase HpnC